MDAVQYFLLQMISEDMQTKNNPRVKRTESIARLNQSLNEVKDRLAANAELARQKKSMEGYIHYANEDGTPIHRLIGNYDALGYSPKKLGEYLLDKAEGYRLSGLTKEQLAIEFAKETIQPIKAIHAKKKEEIRAAYEEPEMTDEEFQLWLLGQYLNTDINKAISDSTTLNVTF